MVWSSGHMMTLSLVSVTTHQAVPASGVVPVSEPYAKPKARIGAQACVSCFESLVSSGEPRPTIIR